MKLLPVTSFFLVILLLFLNGCETSKSDKQKTPSLLSTLEYKIYEKTEKDEYDSAIFYCRQMRKTAIVENNTKFIQNSNNRLSRYFGYLKEYDSAISYGHKFLKLAIIQNDTNSIKTAYEKLSIYYSYSKIKDSTVYFSKNLLDLSVQTGDTINMAKAYSRQGFYYKEIDSFVSAYKNFVTSKNLYLKLGDSSKTANNLLEISSLEKKLGDLISSQLSAIEGLKYVNNPQKIRINSKFYFNIAVAAKEQGDLITAEKRINEALDLAKDFISIKKIELVTVVKYYNTKANIFKEKGNYEDAIVIYESLLNKSLGELPEKEKARINGNLAHTLFLKDGFSKQADSLLKSALTIYKKEEYNSGLITIHMNLAELYSEKDKQKALFYTNEAIQYSKVPYNNISIYEGLKNKALLEPNKKNITEYITLGQKIEKEEDKMQSQFANAKFDFEKEENKRIKAENDKIKAENETAKSENLLLIVLLIFIIVIVLVFIIYQRIKRRHKIEKVKTVHNTEARISTKVHDELANDVYKLMTQLETSDPEREIILDKLDAIYNNARDISKQIQSIDTDTGFPEELNNLFRSYQSDDVNVLLKRYETEIWNGISSHVKTTIYRVLQELLTNMKKHSNAALVVVSIEKRNKELFIQYIDNGKGFTEEISKNGLQNAENRIHAIEGTLTFDTELHKGCKFSINVPV